MDRSEPPSRPDRPPWQAWVAVIVALAGVMAYWLASLSTASPDATGGQRPGPAVAFVSILASPEIAPYLAWLVALVVVHVLTRGFPSKPRAGLPWDAARVSTARRVMVFCLSTCFAFGTAAWYGWPARNLPPAYQDEYSYLFQANTFLSGRLAAPPPPVAESFDQMHVLNVDGIFASRYFPGTGLWYAPWVALGVPYVGGWLWHALTAGFISLAACRLSVVAGALAGLLVGASPGLVLFANTVLSPGPTMLGLAIGWWGFQETYLTRRKWPAALAGAAIGLAFLTRPLTAAAIGLPWAIVAVWNLCRVDMPLRRNVLAMIAAFLPSLLLLGVFNSAVSGSPWRTPHGKWTAVYSPCHVYGFYNRTRGEARRSAKTIEGYDTWAEELTPRRSLTICVRRWTRGVWLMAGFVPTVSLAIMASLLAGRLGNGVLLPLTSAFTLTLAYLPFGFEGIFGYSYIAEATPFLLLAGSLALASVARSRWSAGQRWRAGAWLGLPAVSVAVSLFASLPEAFSPDSEFVHPRRQADHRRRLEESLAPGEPIWIVYDGRIGDDRHGTWVYNDPFLAERILRGWKLDETSPLLDAFPERFVFHGRSWKNGVMDYLLLRPPIGRRENGRVD